MSCSAAYGEGEGGGKRVPATRGCCGGGCTCLRCPALTALLSWCSLAGEEREQDAPCRLCFKHYGFLDTDNVPRDSLEFALLFEQVRAVPWCRGWPCRAVSRVAVP